MKITKIEKETIILFNEAEEKANIYTYNTGLKKRLVAFNKKYPHLCRLEKEEQGSATYLIDKTRVSIRLVRHTAMNAARKQVTMLKKKDLTANRNSINNSSNATGDGRIFCVAIKDNKVRKEVLICQETFTDTSE